MNTTAVQQAPQMLEIQSAPSATEDSSDGFRATFSANLSNAQKAIGAISPGGAKLKAANAAVSSSSAKPLLTAELSLKSLSAAGTGATRGTFVTKGLAAETAALEPARSAVLAVKSDPSFTDAAETKTDDATVQPPTEQPAKPSTLANEVVPVIKVGLDTKNLLASSAAGTSLATLVQTKPVGLSSPEEASVVRTRKQDPSASIQTTPHATELVAQSASLLADGSVPVALPAGLAGQAGLYAVTLAAQGPTLDAGPEQLARTSEKSKVPSGAGQLFTSSNANSDLAVSFSETVNTQNQVNVIAARTVALDTSATQESAATANGGKDAANFQAVIGQGTAAFSDVRQRNGKPGPGSPEAGTQAAGTIAAQSVSDVSLTSAVSKSALGSLAKRQPGTAQAKSVDAAATSGIKAIVGSGESGKTSVSLARALVKPQSGLPAQSLLSAQSGISKVDGSGAESNRATDSKQVEAPSKSADADDTQTLDVKGAATRENSAVPLLDGASGAAILGTSISGALSTAQTKEERAKSSGPALADGTSAASGSVPIPFGSEPNGATSTSLNAVPGNAAGTVSGITTAVAATSATVSVSGSSLHASGSTAGPGVTGRPVNEVMIEANGALNQESNASSLQTVESHRTLLATPTSLEVGVQSGTQGWLRIRAEVGGQGEVNASLAANSSGAREVLHSQMPALNAFLHSEQMAVTTTVLERVGTVSSSSQWAATGSGGLETADRSGGSNASLLHGGEAQSNGSQGEDSKKAFSVSASETVTSYDFRDGSSDIAGSLQGRTGISEESGQWLNVRV